MSNESMKDQLHKATTSALVLGTATVVIAYSLSKLDLFWPLVWVPCFTMLGQLWYLTKAIKLRQQLRRTS
jgi:hypothetical protein